MQASLSKNVTLASRSRRALVIRRAEGGKVSHGKGGEEGGRSFNNDAFGMVAKNANYLLFAAAVSKTGCEEIMTSPGPLTVFAPNDDAFSAFLKKTGKSKMEIMDDPSLPAVIKSHIVEGTYTLADMPDGTTLTTVGGTTLTVSGGAINGSAFKKNDIKVDNAVLHAVDAVIEA
jgi:uncharacterized surface protein with fasciclin (FAS1) repeats